MIHAIVGRSASIPPDLVSSACLLVILDFFFFLMIVLYDVDDVFIAVVAVIVVIGKTLSCELCRSRFVRLRLSLGTRELVGEEDDDDAFFAEAAVLSSPSVTTTEEFIELLFSTMLLLPLVEHTSFTSPSRLPASGGGDLHIFEDMVLLVAGWFSRFGVW